VPLVIPTDKPYQLLTTHALLVGLTPLVPVPLVDDYLADSLRRSMVERLATRRQQALATDVVKGLADEPSRPFTSIGGAAKKVLLWPAKKIFRKVFVVLAVKDGVDLVGKAFALGYLVDASLEHGFTQRHHPKALRLAIDAVCKRVGTSPVNRAAGAAFEQAKTVLPDLADKLRGAISGKRAEPDAGAVGEAFTREVLQVSPGYFERLVDELAKELGEPLPSARA
jgi:hypothetical protein